MMGDGWTNAPVLTGNTVQYPSTKCTPGHGDTTVPADGFPTGNWRGRWFPDRPQPEFPTSNRCRQPGPPWHRPGATRPQAITPPPADTAARTISGTSLTSVIAITSV